MEEGAEGYQNLHQQNVKSAFVLNLGYNCMYIVAEACVKDTKRGSNL
jgi:hypothetical protein